MHEVRTLANSWSDRRGHRIKVSARVPVHPDAAIGLGMDGVTWAKEGLIDVLVPTPFWATSDFDIPIELWKERIGATAKVEVAAGLEILLRAYPGAKQVENDLETTRGCAAEALYRGADAVYLFNYMDPAPMQGGPEAYRKLLEEGLSLDTITQRARKHVITYHDTVPAGVPAGIQLPRNTTDGPSFRMNIGPAPRRGTAVLVLGLKEQEPKASPTVTLNGQPCTLVDPKPDGFQVPDAKGQLGYACPISALRNGYNEVEVRAKTPSDSATIVWVGLRLDPAGQT